MKLNELDEFIIKVNSVASAVTNARENIDERRESFLSNERQTRSGLIDPILRILGWDVSHVDLVGSEYRTGSSGTADYALFAGSDPIALIEAKRLGRSLDVGIVEQLANYTSNERTVRFAIFTNGDHWRMRETGKSGTVIDIHLSKETPLKSALELMRLWRHVLTQDRAERPNIVTDSRSTTAVEVSGSRQSGRTTPGYEKASSGSTLNDKGCLTLEDVSFRTHEPCPKGRLLYSGEKRKDADVVKTYKDLWEQVVEWLWKIESREEWESYFGRFVGHDETRLSLNPRKLSNGYWIITNYSAKAHGENIKKALRHFEVDLNRFVIQTD